MEHGVLVSLWSLVKLKSYDARTLEVSKEVKKAVEGKMEGSLSRPRAWAAYWGSRK